jgi:RNA polymerase sigma-70 factor (ECF subfamily)
MWLCAMMMAAANCSTAPAKNMSCDTSTPGLAEFLTAHSSFLGQLHGKTSAPRWGITQEELAAALYRSALHRFAEGLPPVEALEAYLESLQVEDLALVCALRRGSDRAWEEFVARYRPLLYAAARALVGSAGEARARELADSLYAELYGVEGAGGTRCRALLDYFHGRSKLSTWLRTVLAQRHVDALRAGSRNESIDDEDGSLRPVVAASGSERAGAQDDPDRARLLPQLRRAVAAALVALAPGERLLLSLYYVQEMTLAQVARLRGVHEATVSRQLNAVRHELRKNVERSLASTSAGPAGRAPLSPAEIELCFSYAQEDWAFDLGSALSGGQSKDG